MLVEYSVLAQKQREHFQTMFMPLSESIYCKTFFWGEYRCYISVNGARMTDDMNNPVNITS